MWRGKSTIEDPGVKVHCTLFPLQVQSIVERVIVFLLSRVVDRSLDESVRFSLHPRTESCSLLWRDGQAIGFYTVKNKGVMVGVGGKLQFTVCHREGKLQLHVWGRPVLRNGRGLKCVYALTANAFRLQS